MNMGRLKSGVLTWIERLDQMDCSKGVSNVMRQQCMKAEIKELRAKVYAQSVRIERLSQRAEMWKSAANRYQKQLARSR